MKKNIDIDKKEGKVTVEIEIPSRNYVREPKISFRTKDVTLLLEKEGIEVGTCVKNDVLNNDSRNPKTVGTWIFNLKTEKTQVKKPAVTKKKNQDLTKEEKSANIKKKTKNTK